MWFGIPPGYRSRAKRNSPVSSDGKSERRSRNDFLSPAGLAAVRKQAARPTQRPIFAKVCDKLRKFISTPPSNHFSFLFRECCFRSKKGKPNSTRRTEVASRQNRRPRFHSILRAESAGPGIARQPSLLEGSPCSARN